MNLIINSSILKGKTKEKEKKQKQKKQRIIFF
jgi:hypothetical protein